MSVMIDFKRKDFKRDFNRDEGEENNEYRYMVNIFFSSAAITLFMPVILMFIFSLKEGEFSVFLLYQVLLLSINTISTIIHAITSKVIHSVILMSIQVLANLSLLIHIIVTCQ